MSYVAEFKASVQFDIKDPELAEKLLELSSKLVVTGRATRVSYGSAGKALLEALLQKPELISQLLNLEENHRDLKTKSQGAGEEEAPKRRGKAA